MPLVITQSCILYHFRYIWRWQISWLWNLR